MSMKRRKAADSLFVLSDMDGQNMNNGINSRFPALKKRNQTAKALCIVMMLFGFLVLYHWWWISPTLNAIENRITQNEARLYASHNNVYAGTGQWRNRGLNLVNNLRSMLGDERAYVENVELSIRKLQLQYLKNEKRSKYDYILELSGALHPTSELSARWNKNDGYHQFVTHTLSSIDAWQELSSLLESLKRSKQTTRQTKLKRLASRARAGNAVAAALLARELMSETISASLRTNQSPQEAASCHGPSIAILKEVSPHGVTSPDNVVGFEIRQRNDNSNNATSSVPVVNLAFYKQIFERTGAAVVVLRPNPDSNVTCIADGAGGNIRDVEGITQFYKCDPQEEFPAEESGAERKSGTMWSFAPNRLEGTDNNAEMVPVVGLLFGSDFVGGCKAASRMLDAIGQSENGQHDDDVLWGQEMQNVFSSVSAFMRKQLFVASFDLSSTKEGTTNVRCGSVASFWPSENEARGKEENDNDLQLWQSYRNAAASGVGLDWQSSQCLVRLPLDSFPNSAVVNQTMGGFSLTLEDMNLGPKEHARSVCYGLTGSTCTISLDKDTICEFTCEHIGSYAVSRGVRSAGSQHYSPACFDFERKLETPVLRDKETNSPVTWFSQQKADPVRWTWQAANSLSDVEEEPHSVTFVFTSDVHGRFFRECGPSYCYPGASHIASVIGTVRAAASRSGRVGAAVLVDAGDATFGSQYNETLVGMTMNRLGYDAMALGNHELDIGRRLDDFSELVNFPIVSTNVVGVPFATDFVRVSLNGGAVLCLLGVSANEFNPLAGRNVSFSDEESVIQMSQDLRSQHGCDHTALLSHAGIEADKRFAADSNAKLDAIIGGHSHVLMGVQSKDHTPESSEFGSVSDMSFPFTTAGDSPPVAHTGANGRYLGLLRLYWIGSRLVFTEGNLIPLDMRHGVYPDDEVDKWQAQLIQNGGHENQVQASEIQIDNNLARNDVCGQTCRSQECLMGNLATDAMVSCVTHGPCSEYAVKAETAATIALLESGTLRACVSPDLEDFTEILPWPNNLVLLTMKGEAVRKMLEHGVKDLREGQGGAFLQASGVRYLYRESKIESVLISQSNLSGPYGHRRHITFSSGSSPETEMCGVAEPEQQGASLSDDALYLVVVTDWLASGGDGYGSIVSSADAVTTNSTLRESILEYAKSLPVVSAETRSEAVNAKLTSSTKQGLSGFVGGGLSFLATYPLYTLFVQRSASKEISFSFTDLFAGSTVGMLATALSESIYFSVYSVPELLKYSAFTRSTMAALTNSILTTPLWVIATHQQVNEGGANAFTVAKHVYDEGGVFGFFTGLSMNIVMCVFPVVRQVALEVMISTLSLKDRNHIAVAAAGSSWIATLITFPIQQLRVRMQSGDGKVFRGHYFDGVLFKLLHSCLTSFVLFLVKQHSEMILCILEG